MTSWKVRYEVDGVLDSMRVPGSTNKLEITKLLDKSFPGKSVALVDMVRLQEYEVEATRTITTLMKQVFRVEAETQQEAERLASFEVKPQRYRRFEDDKDVESVEVKLKA